MVIEEGTCSDGNALIVSRTEAGGEDCWCAAGAASARRKRDATKNLAVC